MISRLAEAITNVREGLSTGTLCPSMDLTTSRVKSLSMSCVGETKMVLKTLRRLSTSLRSTLSLKRKSVKEDQPKINLVDYGPRTKLMKEWLGRDYILDPSHVSKNRLDSFHTGQSVTAPPGDQPPQKEGTT